MRLTSLLILVATATLSACAIRQTVSPVTDLHDAQICVITKAGVRDSFFVSLQRALTQKGFEVKQVPQDASLIQCPLMATYDAHWRWDLAMYMAYAEVKVYAQAKPVGVATYDASRGGANFGKFIDADKKISELVQQLFPGGPPR